MTLAVEVQQEVQRALPALRRLSDADASRDRGAGKWTRKQILGHLIDSAFNNHHRFMRAHLTGVGQFEEYAQEQWVSIHRYADRPWTDLVDLWRAVNDHLVYAIDAVPADRLGMRCAIGGATPATLEEWIRDYTRHMKHHLTQLV